MRKKASAQISKRRGERQPGGCAHGGEPEGEAFTGIPVGQQALLAFPREERGQWLPPSTVGCSEGVRRLLTMTPFSAGAGLPSCVYLTFCACISSTEMGYRQTKGGAREAVQVSRKSYFRDAQASSC